MGLPLSKFVSVSASVSKPAFTVEKKHLILAIDNPLMSSETPYIEYSGSSALSDFKKDFGATKEYRALQKYFGWMGKTGLSPDKAIIVRWYKADTAPFVKGGAVATLATLKAITDGSFKIAFNTDTPVEITGLDFSAVNSYSEIATIIQTALRAETGDAFTGATVEYSSLTGGFIITGGVAGKNNTMAITAGETGTDVSGDLGLIEATVSAGVDAETFAELCDRIYNMNTAGFAITTLETIEQEDMVNAVAFINSTIGEQTVNTKLKLVFNFADKTNAETLQTTLQALSYTGYVITYDPNGENVNILDCAIGATVDYTADNGAINFNFQPATGYTPITTMDSAVDYQAGITNVSLANELDSYKISYVYSVGVGAQEEILYGMGLMAGAFGVESCQQNESWLETDLQTAVMNGFVSLNNVKLQGSDASDFMSAMIAPTFVQGVKNGTIANGGLLLNNDKLVVSQTLGANAIEAIEANGYYYKIMDLTAEDIAAKRVRILCAYLSAGVVNQVRVINQIFGA